MLYFLQPGLPLHLEENYGSQQEPFIAKICLLLWGASAFLNGYFADWLHSYSGYCCNVIIFKVIPFIFFFSERHKVGLFPIHWNAAVGQVVTLWPWLIRTISQRAKQQDLWIEIHWRCSVSSKHSLRIKLAFRFLKFSVLLSH